MLGQVAGSGSDNGVVCFTGVLAILLILLIYLFPTLSTFFLLLLLSLAFSSTLRIYLVCSLHLPFSNLFNLFTTPSHYLAPNPSIETLNVSFSLCLLSGGTDIRCGLLADTRPLFGSTPLVCWVDHR